MRPGPPSPNENEANKRFTWREQWKMIRSFASYYPFRCESNLNLSPVKSGSCALR